MAAVAAPVAVDVAAAANLFALDKQRNTLDDQGGVELSFIPLLILYGCFARISSDYAFPTDLGLRGLL